MKYQKGFFHLSDADFFGFLAIVIVVGGFIIYVGIPWLWKVFKPLLHAISG